MTTPPPPPSAQPPWIPPADTLPGFPDLTVDLATNQIIAARLYGFRVWPQSFQFTLLMLINPNLPPADTQVYENPMFAPAHLRGDEFARDRLFHLHVGFNDGTHASSTDPPWNPTATDRRGPRVVLTGGGHSTSQAGGHPGGGLVRYDFTVWPLPPPGPVTFSCAWDYYQMPPAQTVIDAATITDSQPTPVNWT